MNNKSSDIHGSQQSKIELKTFGKDSSKVKVKNVKSKSHLHPFTGSPSHGSRELKPTLNVSPKSNSRIGAGLSHYSVISNKEQQNRPLTLDTPLETVLIHNKKCMGYNCEHSCNCGGACSTIANESNKQSEIKTSGSIINNNNKLNSDSIGKVGGMQKADESSTMLIMKLIVDKLSQNPLPPNNGFEKHISGSEIERNEKPRSSQHEKSNIERKKSIDYVINRPPSRQSSGPQDSQRDLNSKDKKFFHSKSLHSRSMSSEKVRTRSQISDKVKKQNSSSRDLCKQRSNSSRRSDRLKSHISNGVIKEHKSRKVNRKASSATLKSQASQEEMNFIHNVNASKLTYNSLSTSTKSAAKLDNKINPIRHK
ncbi:hypothetical protein BLOT_006258 [Blomia tropicalis]|nr:hypothetical protein BLOT_006258 [Blomia tropicalis]